MHDVIIIGAGPAGLTAGLYTGRAGLKVLMIEGVSEQSQMSATAYVENYPGFPDGIGGSELMDRMKKQVSGLGINFINADVASIKFATKDGGSSWEVNAGENKYTALALIIATGSKPKVLKVPGEEKFKGKGVSYCAVCDAFFFRDKELVVIGGGDSAIEETIFLTKFAKKIKVVHRRDRLRAAKILQDHAFENKKIEFVWNSEVTEILGADKVEGAVVKNKVNGAESRIKCDGVFVFVGYTPNTEFARGFVELDSDGYIVAGEDMRTKSKGLFACGDCRQKMLRQIVTACSDGAIAAFESQHYIEKIKGI